MANWPVWMPTSSGVKVQAKLAVEPTAKTGKLAGLTVGPLIVRLGSSAALGVRAAADAKPLLRTVKEVTRWSVVCPVQSPS